MKRHGFHGLGAGHGAQRKHRSPGSIGACATPGRVFKGVRMAGRMGHERQTDAEPDRAQGRRRAGPAAHQGRRSRPEGRPGARPYRGEGEPDDGAVAITVTDPDVDDRRPRAPQSVELPAEIFDVAGQHPADPPGRRRPSSPRPGRARTSTKTPRRGPRWRQEAVPAEGHRPRPSGLDPRAAVRRRWRRARPARRADYSQRTPKKMKAAALRGALSDRARNGRLHVVCRRWSTGDTPSTQDGVRPRWPRSAEPRATSWSSLERTDELTWKSLRNVPRSAPARARPAQHLRRAGQRRRGLHPGPRSERVPRRSPAKGRVGQGRRHAPTEAADVGGVGRGRDRGDRS